MNGKYSSVSSSDFLKILLADDKDAWSFVWQGIVGTVQRSRKYGEMLTKKNLDAEDVANQVYLDLHRDDFRQLRGFRAEGPFSNWLSKVVKSAVGKLVNANSREMPEDHTDPISAVGQASQPDVPQWIKDWLVDAREEFVSLWKERPDWFWSLWLTQEIGLSSRTVANVLETSEDNVNTMSNRARKEMRRQESKNNC